MLVRAQSKYPLTDHYTIQSPASRRTCPSHFFGCRCLDFRADRMAAAFSCRRGSLTLLLPPLASPLSAFLVGPDCRAEETTTVGFCRVCRLLPIVVFVNASLRPLQNEVFAVILPSSMTENSICGGVPLFVKASLARSSSLMKVK